jgi:hypothetical protein
MSTSAAPARLVFTGGATPICLDRSQGNEPYPMILAEESHVEPDAAESAARPGGGPIPVNPDKWRIAHNGRTYFRSLPRWTRCRVGDRLKRGTVKMTEATETKRHAPTVTATTPHRPVVSTVQHQPVISTIRHQPVTSTPHRAAVAPVALPHPAVAVAAAPDVW